MFWYLFELLTTTFFRYKSWALRIFFTHARFFITTLFVMYLFLFFWLSNLQVKFVKSAQETNNFCYLKRHDSISERNPTQLQYQILSYVINKLSFVIWRILIPEIFDKKKEFFVNLHSDHQNWTKLNESFCLKM